MSYESIGKEIGSLVDTKQKAYGDSFSKSGAVMMLLYQDGIPLEKLDDALTVVRIIDKLFRIATDRDALGEDPWKDIAGYALLSVARGEKARGVTRIDNAKIQTNGSALVPDVIPIPGIGEIRKHGPAKAEVIGGRPGLRFDGTRIGSDEGRVRTVTVLMDGRVEGHCEACGLAFIGQTSKHLDDLIEAHQREEKAAEMKRAEMPF